MNGTNVVTSVLPDILTTGISIRNRKEMNFEPFSSTGGIKGMHE
jgi:hypothetical protein